jgi:hypothetical protein
LIDIEFFKQSMLFHNNIENIYKDKEGVMPINPETDRFAGIEETEEGLRLRWVNAADPKGFTIDPDEFAKDFAHSSILNSAQGNPAPEQMRLAQAALEPYLSERTIPLVPQV